MLYYYFCYIHPTLTVVGIVWFRLSIPGRIVSYYHSTSAVESFHFAFEIDSGFILINQLGSDVK